MKRTRRDIEFQKALEPVLERNKWVIQLLESVQVPIIPVGTGGHAITLQTPAPAPDFGPSKGPWTMPRAEAERRTMAGPHPATGVSVTNPTTRRNTRGTSGHFRTAQTGNNTTATARTRSSTSKAQRIPGNRNDRVSHESRNRNSLPNLGPNRISSDAQPSNGTTNTRDTGQAESLARPSRAPVLKRPSNFKRPSSKLTAKQEKGAMTWNRRWVNARFPVIRGTFIDDMTNVYLKFVEKVATRVTHSWHTNRLYTNGNFRDLMETAREFEKTKEDANSPHNSSVISKRSMYPRKMSSLLQIWLLPQRRVVGADD